MFANSRRCIAVVVAIGACSLAGASCSSSNSPGVGSGGAGGGGGATVGTGGAPASTGGATSDSGNQPDAATLLSAPVLDPTGTYGGKTYTEWVVAWMKWILELPGPDFPNLDSTGALCSLGQSAASDGGATQADVFFLAGDFSGGAVTRSCTIPAGRMLFFPLMDWEDDNLGVDAGSSSYDTDQQLQAYCSACSAAVNALSLEIDGKSFGSKVSDFAAYLTGPTLFAYTLPDTSTNFWTTAGQCPTGCSGPIPDAFCGGYWILLAPLSVGSHTIHLIGTRGPITVNGGSSGPFTFDVTYNLTVE